MPAPAPMRSSAPSRAPATTRPFRKPWKKRSPISASVRSAPSGLASPCAGTRSAASATTARPTSKRKSPRPRPKPRSQQVHEKLRQQDLTKDLDLTSEAAALCPSCGARTQGAKFCPECGKPLHAQNECSRCGTKFEAGTKFCPECGQKDCLDSHAHLFREIPIYANPDGSALQSGPCRVSFEAETLTLTPASGAPLALDLGDIDLFPSRRVRIDPDPLHRQENPANQFGKTFQNLCHDLLEAYRKAAAMPAAGGSGRDHAL